MTPAKAHGYALREIKYDNQTWPTIFPAGRRDLVDGETIQVDDQELHKLDKWESNYHRKAIMTDQGNAWTYVFMRPRVAATLGQIAKWK